MKRFMSNGTKVRRVSRRVRRAARELTPRVARALLVLVLVLSTAMSTGFVYAAVGDTGQQTTPVTGDGTQGDGATTVMTPQDPATSDPSTTPTTDASTTTADPSTTPESTTPSQTATPATGGASDEGTTPAPETETPGTPGTPEAETKTERTAPRAWEGDTDALELASEGLTFAADEAAASALQVALDEDPDAPLAQLIGSALADGVPATLNLTLSLDPTASTSLDGTLYASVIAGDTVTVPLPEGVTAEEGATVDVWQRAEDGTATSTRIGTARVQGGSIVVEFQAPSTRPPAPPYAVGEVAEGSETPVLATLEASVDLGVRVDASAFGEEASQVAWTLQTGADGTAQTATLAIPSAADLAATLGVAMPEDGGQDGEEELAGTEGMTDEQVANAVLAAGMLALNTDGVGTVTVATDFSEHAKGSITWGDNNSASRPSLDSIVAGMMPQFTVDGTTWYDLVDADGNLTQKASELLHLTQDQLPTPLVSGSAAGNVYSITTGGLPTNVETQRTYYVDAQGNEVTKPVYDVDGNVLTKTETMAGSQVSVSWRLADRTGAKGDGQIDGYFRGTGSGYAEDGSLVVYQLLTDDLQFDIVAKIGDDDFPELLASLPEDAFMVSATIDGVTQEQPTSLRDLIASGDLKLELTDTGAVISGRLPRYDQHNKPIVYSIAYTGAQTGSDYYQATYDNSAAPNHGSSTNAVYSGGTMTLRHSGLTTYSADKVWADDGDASQRPAVTYTL